MRIVAEFDFNNGKSIVESEFVNELKELKQAIYNIDSSICKTKQSLEKNMVGKILYAPRKINSMIKDELNEMGWKSHRENCNYEYGLYSEDYIPPQNTKSAYREMDFVKNKLGVEVQFGKYAFMVYNVCAKMTIFKNLGIIKAGVEIVPVKHFSNQMSTGVSYFEQFAWDLTYRGVSDIDIPVLILGVDE